MQETSNVIDGVIRSGEEVQEKFRDAKERVTRVAERASERGSQMWDDTVQMVRRRPGQSLGIALAAGAAMGALAVALLSRDEEPRFYRNLRKAAGTGQEGLNDFYSSFEKGIAGLKQAFDGVKSAFR